MTFLQPYLLWAALAVAIPILIHLWHQKKGQVMAWAATQWLVEKSQQQQRGLKLDNLPLLLVRCLLIVLLALMLSRPVLKGLNEAADNKPIHLVQPNALITTNFRFELEEAAKRGEKLYWIDEPAELIESLAQFPEQAGFSPLLLQTGIDKIRRENTELHVYILNDEALAAVPAIYVPTRFQLHTTVDSTRKPLAYLVAKGNKKLVVSPAGLLTTSALTDPSVRLQETPVHSGAVRVLLDYRNPGEEKTVEAALNALADVYGLDLQMDRKPTNSFYDWVLTDRIVTNPVPKTLYIISGKSGYPTNPNVVYSEQPFTPQTDERVSNGQLPEWLGERLFQHFGLINRTPALSPKELHALFIAADRPDRKPQTLVHTSLLLLFSVLFGLERWMALTKNA